MSVKTFPTTEHLKEYFSGREKLLGIMPVEVEEAEFLPEGWILVPCKDGRWDVRVHEIAVLVFFDGKQGSDYAITVGTRSYTNQGQEVKEDTWYITGVPEYISTESLKRLARIMNIYTPPLHNFVNVFEDKVPKNIARERVRPFDWVINGLLSGGQGKLNNTQRTCLISCIREQRDILSCL